MQRAESNLTDSSGSHAPDPALPEPPRGYAHVARRTSTWATNLLATGVVLVGSLVLGRQIIAWWGEAPPGDSRQRAIEVVGPGDLGSPDLTHQLTLGHSPHRIARASFSGPRVEARKRLAAMCRDAGLASAWPESPASESELRMLATLERLTPIAQQPGWQLYELNGPVPLMAFIRTAPARPEAVSPRRRVVSWGLGLVQASDEWTLLSFGVGPSPDPLPSSLPPLPVPPGAQRTLSISAASHEALLGIQGPGTPESYTDFYQQHFEQAGLPRESSWQYAGGTWHARFGTPERGWVDVQIASDEQGLARAMLLALPPTEQPEITRANEE